MTRSLGMLVGMLLSCLAVAETQAQVVIGRSVLEGEVVLLYSDQTWAYEKPTTLDCETVAPDVAFCGDRAVWREIEKPNPFPSVNWLHRSGLVAELFSERFPRGIDVTPEWARDAILHSARTAFGDIVAEVRLLDRSPCIVDGVEGDGLTYAISQNGADRIMRNCVILNEARALQFMTHQMAPDLSDEHAALHDLYLSHIDFVEEGDR